MKDSRAIFAGTKQTLLSKNNDKSHTKLVESKDELYKNLLGVTEPF